MQRRQSRRVQVGLSLLLASWCLEAGGPTAWSSNDGALRSLEAKAGATVERALCCDARHAYPLRLRAGNYLQLSLQSSGIDVALSVSAPGNGSVIQAAHRQKGIKRVSLVISTSGDHRIGVRALDACPAKGRYRLRIEVLRASVESDLARVEAAQRFNEAEALRDHWTAKASREALRAYQAALEGWAGCADRVGQARALRRAGDALQSLGEVRQARESYRAALDGALEVQDREEQVGALNGLSQVELALGENELAVRHAGEARVISRENDWPAAEAEALNNLGDVQALQGRTRDSLETYGEALSLAESAEDRRQQARSLLNRGYSYSDLSEVERALRAHEAALSLYTELDDRLGRAVTLNALGHLLSKMGERQKALGRYLEARDIFEILGEPLGGGITANGLGLVYLELGEIGVALDYYRQQLRLHQTAGFRQGEGGALAQIGRCHYLMGNPSQALDYLRDAVAILESIEDRKVETYARGLLGLAYEGVGDVQGALSAQQRSLELSRELGDRREESYALNRIARLLHEQGRTTSALEHLRRARALSRDSSDRVGEALSLFNTAVIESELGRPRLALGKLRDSLALSESLRTDVASLDLRSSYFASVRERRELEIEVLMGLHEQDATKGYDRLAYEASEEARARSLLDGLVEARAGIREGVDPDLLQRENSIRRALNAKAERFARLDRNAVAEEEVRGLKHEIDALTNERRELEAEIRAASPRFAALMQPQPLGLVDVQTRVVDEQSVLLQYFVGDRRSFLWVVTPDTIETHVLPPRRKLERLVRELRAFLSGTGPSGADSQNPERSPEAASAELGSALLGPIAGRFSGKRLLIAGDGILQLVPFGALPRSQTGSGLPKQGDWWLSRHEIVYLPSASTVALIRGEWEQTREWPRSIAVFADPVFEADDPRIRRGKSSLTQPFSREANPAPRPFRGLEGSSESPQIVRLLETRAEARAIAALVPDAKLAIGFDANRETATSPGLADFKIIHFATHGLINNDHPELSGVVLSLFDPVGTPQDGFLRLQDIYNLHLPADLVVLSACSTALGRQVTGEGLVGLVRGFMYAGSRRVVASLWDVDDEATSELMKRFYQGVFEDGLAPPAALRVAQLAMSEQRRWRHPRNWAAFILQGEWRAGMRDDIPPHSTP